MNKSNSQGGVIRNYKIPRLGTKPAGPVVILGNMLLFASTVHSIHNKNIQKSILCVKAIVKILFVKAAVEVSAKTIVKILIVKTIVEVLFAKTIVKTLFVKDTVEFLSAKAIVNIL